jgi:hypothetical protein
MYHPYELLLFGGSQAGVADAAKGRLSSHPDALWHCNLLEGEWRTVPTKGATPSARSGHSAVVYDKKVLFIVKDTAKYFLPRLPTTGVKNDYLSLTADV